MLGHVAIVQSGMLPITQAVLQPRKREKPVVTFRSTIAIAPYTPFTAFNPLCWSATEKHANEYLLETT
ncbi:hypothetical protein EGR_09279 [Echinococcus granulosus]|uniref:Uncharacterized protein n=1 Tax=Echinococcus granulosus TaxID=6210 RepID=W6U5L2_ECHGR|nr:hypothetical protein EGR_09279 [Echinococcus granulosus]EUB55876.1 hypothetical protein EGR_09279 [Echinococcus granulosus]